MDATFLQERIDATKAQIIAYEDAMTEIMGVGVQSYTFDDGQTRQTVTRRDTKSLEATISSLYNRLTVLQQRLHGRAQIVRPGF